MLTDREKLRDYFIQYDKNVISDFVKEYYKLKYDYSSPLTIAMLEDLINCDFSNFNDIVVKDTDKPFKDYFLSVNKDLKDERVYNHFLSVLSSAKIIKREGYDFENTRARITMNDDRSNSLTIEIPSKSDSNLLYAALMHEYTHLFMFTKNKNRQVDCYEYSEVPSMYLEYLMYKKMDPENGLSDFINNRIISIKSSLMDCEEDLLYAKNPNYLMLPTDIYNAPLSSELSIPEGLEYVLNLIDREEELKGCSYDLIAKVLLGVSTCEKEAKILDIDTSKFKKIKKLTKK